MIEVVAAVDINLEFLKNAQQHLNLRPDQCYTDLNKAFDENKADFCTIVVPPAFHEQVVDIALEHDMHILSEKPIADSLAASVRIADKVKKAGKKMGVTMSHRFDQDKTSLRKELRSGKHGALDYIICRFTCDCRRFASWGEFRHKIPDALIVEGAVHHLDIQVDLAGAKCDTIYAQIWNSEWGEYVGDSQGLVIMHFENGTRAFYEGAKSNAVGLNGWSQEYFKVESKNAILILNRRSIECFSHDNTASYCSGVEGKWEIVPLIEQPKWANTWLIEKFVR